MSIVDKILIDTLEGEEHLRKESIICLGLSEGEIWQQTSYTLLKKYSVINIDDNGWMICKPREGNEVDVIETAFKPGGELFYIIGKFGGEVNGEQNAQVGQYGDFICRSKTDHLDVWIVKRKLFLNTYVIQG
jgi:hypothetical protein